VSSCARGRGFTAELCACATAAVTMLLTHLLTGTYDQGEIAYMWLSLFAKGVLGLLVLSNVLMLGSFTEIYES
jgi:hypothetical protein